MDSAITSLVLVFFFNDTATTEIYTLSLHDALPCSTRTSPAGPPTSRSTTRSAESAWPRAESRTARVGSRSAHRAELVVKDRGDVVGRPLSHLRNRAHLAGRDLVQLALVTAGHSSGALRKR